MKRRYWRKNKRFNRYEAQGHHEYVREFPSTPIGSVKYGGLVKCRLAHGLGYSIIVPDQLYLQDRFLRWFQPLYFSACLLCKSDDDIECRLYVDISHGHRLGVVFTASGLIQKFEDGAELYRCQISGPPDLAEYYTGYAEENSELRIALFHHTAREARSAILESGHYRPSHWNIQGNKKLKNIAYVYFTCLESITVDEDLYQIAMASNSKIALQRDNTDSISPRDVIILDVYRESTLNRRHSLQNLVSVSCLAPQHLHKHSPIGQPVYYAVVSPFIYRVGIEPESCLPFQGQRIDHSASHPHRFEYIVVGDATTLDGLGAPYDEENTKDILKIERSQKDSNILEFWFEYANSDLFSGKAVEYKEFQKTESI